MISLGVGSLPDSVSGDNSVCTSRKLADFNREKFMKKKNAFFGRFVQVKPSCSGAAF